MLRRRAELLARLRAFFVNRGFLEVETPLLSADVAVDRHLEPFVVFDDDVAQEDRPNTRAGRRLWLQTSPEFAMKRLMAAGGEAIFQVTRSFRRGERGPLHNPEFTIVEWYRRGDDMQAGMTLLSDLCVDLLGTEPAERISYREAFGQSLGIDPHTATDEALIAAAHSEGIAAPHSLSADDRDGWLDLLLVERVQPRLGIRQPTIVYDFPASQAALARLRDENPQVAERFELYIHGIELANGYHELTDPAELRRRFEHANHQRGSDFRAKLPLQSRLITAMQAGLPPSTGVALGFDRLVMIDTGARSIDEVIAFPFERA